MTDISVQLGDVIFVIDGNTGTQTQRNEVAKTIALYNWVPAMRAKFLAKDLDHSLPTVDGKPIIYVKVGDDVVTPKNTDGVGGGGGVYPSFEVDSNGQVIVDPNDGLYKVDQISVHINPAEIDASKYNGVDGDSDPNNDWHETNVPSVLGNEIGNAAGTINKNLDIPEGGGTKDIDNENPNKSLGYPWGADENGNPLPPPPIPPEGEEPETRDDDWNIQDGGIEKHSAETEDIIHDIFDEPPRVTEQRADGSATYDAGGGDVTNDPTDPNYNAGGDHKPLYPSDSDWVKALQKVLDKPAEHIKDLIDKIKEAIDKASPLVIDMDGDGIELSSIENGVYWDIDEDGFAEKTGWVTGGDGLLAIDHDGDGIITNHNELFGNQTTDGFSILRQYDTNGDDVIDISDNQYSDLVVWIDQNENGVGESDELVTLAGAGITEISLEATVSNYDIAGNTVTHESTLTINGQTQDIVDAW